MPDDINFEEQLTEAQSQIEALQSSAADAEARAATLQERLTDSEAELARLREAENVAGSRITEAESASESARQELEQTRTDLETSRSRLREATLKYRETRLASAPEIPAELVPQSDSLEQIERDFEAAQRVVGELRQKIVDDAEAEKRSARVPPGSPTRRQPNVSSLSPTEKITLGLQQRAEREGR
ncbi:MAG: hypothetical protein IH957_04210 [Chloroflexi bacterium]|nr:hypothetical protein [Chloroflexota bacterium]